MFVADVLPTLSSYSGGGGEGREGEAERGRRSLVANWPSTPPAPLPPGPPSGKTRLRACKGPFFRNQIPLERQLSLQVRECSQPSSSQYQRARPGLSPGALPVSVRALVTTQDTAKARKSLLSPQKIKKHSSCQPGRPSLDRVTARNMVGRGKLPVYLKDTQRPQTSGAKPSSNDLFCTGCSKFFFSVLSPFSLPER